MGLNNFLYYLGGGLRIIIMVKYTRARPYIRLRLEQGGPPLKAPDETCNPLYSPFLPGFRPLECLKHFGLGGLNERG